MFQKLELKKDGLEMRQKDYITAFSADKKFIKTLSVADEEALRADVQQKTSQVSYVHVHFLTFRHITEIITIWCCARVRGLYLISIRENISWRQINKVILICLMFNVVMQSMKQTKLNPK